MRPTKAENPFSATKGTTLFNINCAGCHIKKTNRAANANDIHNSAPGVVTAKNASYLYLPPYLNNGYTQFRDPDNYPALLSRRGER